jgi:hypothetical protein
MTTAALNGIEICYECFGDPDGEPLLLIHGLGAQYTDWDPAFTALFVDQGFWVIEFDNRDVGQSTWFDERGTPDFGAILAGDQGQATYLIADLASDAAALVTYLGLSTVNVLGVSMGGMIAQQFAIDYPSMTKTLTSIMSTPDPTEVGQPTTEAVMALMQPAESERQAAIDQSIATAKIIGSTGFDFDEDAARARAAIHFDRGHHPDGAARQTAAIFCSPDRRPGLAQVSVPALVIHGDIDPLVTLPGGEATAAALRDADLWIVPGMGHDLPRAIWPELVDRVKELTSR